MRAAGADVWEGRWVVVVLDDGGFDAASVAPSFDEAVAALSGVRMIGVDMPVGLPPDGARRRCDELARRFVGERRSSVFWTPCAALLGASTYADARALATTRGWPGVAAQAYALKKKILEVQDVAREDPRVVEVHPEVSFAQAKGGTLAWPKTSWNGVNERMQLLLAQGVTVPSRLPAIGPAGIADVLDAAIVAWSAHRVARGVGRSMPDDPGGAPVIWR